jgi:hypothetical protein
MARTKKRHVAPSVVAGFILAFIEMGLPMIGVSVNLWLGSLLLTAAFALFGWGVWNFETNRHYGKLSRVGTVIFVGIVYFGLLGYQIRSYKKQHEAGSALPNCTTGNATATGSDNVAVSGCGNDLSSGKSK